MSFGWDCPLTVAWQQGSRRWRLHTSEALPVTVQGLSVRNESRACNYECELSCRDIGSSGWPRLSLLKGVDELNALELTDSTPLHASRMASRWSGVRTDRLSGLERRCSRESQCQSAMAAGSGHQEGQGR